MSELTRLADALNAGARSGTVTVLATVVRTEGSTYRRTGARMAILADGARTGVVSAGCIEHDLVTRAEGIRLTGVSQVLRYDTRSPDDLVSGFGLGCGGVVEVLLQPLAPHTAASSASRLLALANARRPVVLATVIRTSRRTHWRVGDQGVLASAEASVDGLDGPFHARIQRVARHVLRRARSVTVCHRWMGETIDVAYEVIVPRVRLAVCGAGADAVPLVATAKRLDWYVTLIDDRPAMAAKERWPNADRVLVPPPSDLAASAAEADCEAAIIMSHNFERDAEFLAGWLATGARYVGVMGPRHRTEALIETLRSRGVSIDPDARERIHGPVGLDIGADSPEEIAVAIVAEVQAVHAGRRGRFLVHRAGAIHTRGAAPRQFLHP